MFEMRLPTAIGRRRYVMHLGVSEHLRAVAHRVGQVCESDRVLGTDVAAAAAIAATGAGRLRDTGWINRVLKTHRHRRSNRLQADCFASQRQGLELRTLVGGGVLTGPDPALGPRITFRKQAVLYDLVWPN